MERGCTLLFTLSSFCLLFVFSSCTQEDVADIYFGTEVAVSNDSTSISFLIETLNEAERVAIFERAHATTLVVQLEGFLQPKTVKLPISRLGERYYVSAAVRAFPNKVYTVTKMYLVDNNRTIVAVVPVEGALWSTRYDRAYSLPVTFTSKSRGNAQFHFRVISALGANLELTGYNYTDLSTPPTKLPLKFSIQIVNNAFAKVPVAGSITIKRKENSRIVVVKKDTDVALKPILINALYYYDLSDLFLIYVEGFSSTGYKSIVVEKSAQFIMDNYDLNQGISRTGVLEIGLQ